MKNFVLKNVLKLTMRVKVRISVLSLFQYDGEIHGLCPGGGGIEAGHADISLVPRNHPNLEQRYKSR